MKSVTKFSGGGGVDLGMIAAGWEHTYGIEYDDRIAQVARDNGLNTITADILAIKPEDYSGMDWMHDSPPCPNFSTAKANGKETENDIALAQAVCDWIVYHLPRFYTLENVYGYRLSKSWEMIADTLNRHGYLFNYWHVSMADYGVPQTRKRMIVIARRDGIMPQLPPATHAENPQVGLFDTKNRWASWYEVISDIYESKKPYQPTGRILGKTSHVDNVLIDMQNTSFEESRLTAREKHKPSFTLSSNKSLTEYLIKDSGKYYQSTNRFVCRFQTFPDTYTLPESNTLAARIIGNAVPPLFMQQVGEMFTSNVEAL